MNKFNKTIYYIEGLDLMVGEVDDINKYNFMMSIGNIYDDLEKTAIRKGRLIFAK